MIWVVGATGMLGTELSVLLKKNGIAFVGSDREVDIRSQEAIDQFASGKGITWVINCAAYTAVEKAESEPELAQTLNRDAPANLARWCQANNATLVHISTDYVFPGKGNKPYSEDDPVGPVNVYGRTKEAGEQAIRALCSRHFILRTAWLYGEHGPSFVGTMLKLMRDRESLNVVGDQWGAPTWTRDLSEFIEMILKTASTKYGTYHVSGNGTTSWLGFARAIQQHAFKAGLLKAEIPIHEVTSDEYPTKVKRPTWSVLSKEKIEREFLWYVPSWEESLKKYVETLKGSGI